MEYFLRLKDFTGKMGLIRNTWIDILNAARGRRITI